MNKSNLYQSMLIETKGGQQTHLLGVVLVVFSVCLQCNPQWRALSLSLHDLYHSFSASHLKPTQSQGNEEKGSIEAYCLYCRLS